MRRNLRFETACGFARSGEEVCFASEERNMDKMTLVLLAWLACTIAGACAGSGKRAEVLGALLGAILGPLGVFAALGLDRRLQCPICTGRIDRRFGEFGVGVEAICQHCHSSLNWDIENKKLFPVVSDATTPRTERIN
jgi:hypothetical protein